MQTDVVIVGAGPSGIFTALQTRDDQARHKTAHRHRGKRPRGGTAPLPEGRDRPLRQLQAVLPYHHRLFRRGRVFGRQALALLRSRRRSAFADRPGYARRRRSTTPTVSIWSSARTTMSKASTTPRGQRDPPPRDSGGPEACRLPDSPPRHGKSAGYLLCHRAVSAAKRRGDALWPRLRKRNTGKQRL